MPDLTPEKQHKQELYRDARFTGTYSTIWQSVGKCVFCDLREKYVFFEENGIVMTINLFAYIDGSFMIIPRRHVRSPKELTQVEWDTVRKFMYIAKKMIKEVHGIGAMQLVQKDGSNAQSTVDQHLHFHCIPFDAPDLCVWNYRKLKFTPLENVALYKKDRKKIIEHSLKYDKKYRQQTSLRIVCDAVILNSSREVLFQERRKDVQFIPNYLTLPGGGIEDVTRSLEAELAREVLEETNVDISNASAKLIASRISTTITARRSAQLHATYPSPSTFLWNTYLIEGPLDLTTLAAGDDCAALVWIRLDEIAAHPRMSPGMKQTFRDLSL